ncbi:glycosyltransferase [Luteimonas soli]|uniref:Glycosyltransferase n=1 Tax=Luteimonas soli TaxID=1648966 RepID=A0ABV7XJ08_9GAMM
MAIVFWLAALAVAFTYAGYPLLMALLARLGARPVRLAPCTPTIDVLLVVHDGAELVGAKLGNLLALDYPADRLRVNLVCDGCNDDTEAAARAVGGPRLRVFAHESRRGKSACIADVLPHLDSELVLFTDVRQRIDTGAARALAAVFADARIGAASGELVLEADTGYGRGIDAYWRYEKLLRRLESASGSIIGATGALYAARRALLTPPPPGIILDDMWIPLAIAAGGYRIVFVPDALAHDRGASDSASEETRKRRTLAGNYQLLHRWPRLALPGAHPLALRLWGHKWLRLAAPWCLLVLLASNAWLARGGDVLYLATLGLQAAAYLLALGARARPALAGAWLPARLCGAFLSLNLSAGLALLDYLRNPNAHLWRTTRLEATGR